MSFSASMSSHTSPVPSEGLKASPLRVHLFGIRGIVAVTLGWNSSTEKLVVVSLVLVGGGSGAPAGGSAIGPVLVAARYSVHNDDFISPTISTTTRSNSFQRDHK